MEKLKEEEKKIAETFNDEYVFEISQSSQSSQEEADLFNSSRISFSIDIGAVVGLYRLTGIPSRPIRNFVKFHLILLWIMSLEIKCHHTFP